MRPRPPARGLRCFEVDRARGRFLPHAATRLSPWEAVYQQTCRWLRAGIFEMVHDLRVILRLVSERAHDPTAAILDGRTMVLPPRAGTGPATTEPNARRARRCTRPWTP